jgi:hypothetical protein
MIEEEQENIVYVEPNIEHELPKDKRQTCREILKEIKEFGVNQRQILFLIHLLAMELENQEAMRAISKAVGDVRKEIPVGNKLILAEQPKNNKKLVF